MKWALHNNLRILPNPLIKNATCPSCNLEVIPKCGKIKRWHWAHKNGFDCDDWKGEETAWHLDWKNKFPNEWQEVIIKKDFGNNEIVKHRADIKTKSGLVIEFQNSNISEKDIAKRETFYEKMIWILSGKSFAQNLILRKKGDFYTFRWKWPPKSWFYSKKNVYIDLQPLVDEWFLDLSKKENIEEEKLQYRMLDKILEFSNELFLIKKVYPTLPCGGWGILINKNKFVEDINNGYCPDQ